MANIIVAQLLYLDAIDPHKVCLLSIMAVVSWFIIVKSMEYASFVELVTSDVMFCANNACYLVALLF